MKIDKLETDGKISKVKLLHDCAGTLRTAAALKNSLDKSAASVTKKHQALQNAQQQDLQGTNVTATLFNYQKALAAAERQAGVLYKEVQKTTIMITAHCSTACVRQCRVTSSCTEKQSFYRKPLV